MFSFLAESFTRGIKRLWQHPQLAYTIFLSVIIVGSFLFIGYLFIDVAQDARDRLVDVRTGALHDVFVAFAGDHLDDPALLEERIREIAGRNEVIEGFQVVVFDEGRRNPPRVIAALESELVGGRDDQSEVYRHAYSDLSYTFPFQDGDGRYFVSVRGIAGPDGEVAGALVTRERVSEADRAIDSRIQNSTIVLISLLILIVALFLRHSKIIDYAQLYKKLKELDQMKDDFISMASHELRTPLTHIRGYVDLLRDSVSGEKEQTMLEQIDARAQDLDGLVADMLDVKRLEQGRMNFEYQQIKPDAVVEEVAQASRKGAEDKGLELRCNIKSTARLTIDPRRLRQVLVNLVGNSVKYTDRGMIILKQEKKGDLLEIRVHDTGQGMSAEEQAQLFQKFSRVGSKDQQKKIKGTGLGLWITKQIVEQMGGMISVESIEGVGSDFIVKFPVVVGDSV